jgi:hypothetical protein
LRSGKEKLSSATRKVRPLYPISPLDVKQREEFCQTLDKMGLRGLLDLCWDFDDQAMCDEVYLGKPHPDFKNSIKAQPKKITEKMIGEAFGVSTDGEDAVKKGDNRALSFFPSQSISSTDGWQVKQCNDPTFQRVLAFLNPLLYPQKPHRVTVRMASTVAACLFHNRQTNWASVFHEVITKQVVGKQNLPTSVSCYLVHLYKHQNLLTAEELDEYETHQEVVEGGNPDQRSASHSDEESEEDELVEISGPVTRRKSLRG